MNKLNKPSKRLLHTWYERLETRSMLAGDVASLLPDLIPIADQVRGFLHGWTVQETDTKTLLRLSTTTVNLGKGPLELRGGKTYPNGTQDVNQRIYHADGSFVDTLAGQFVYHPTHEHVHFEGYAAYNLRSVLPNDGVGDLVGVGGKTSFCLLDVFQDPRPHRGQPETPQYSGCGSTRQGLSVGWADMYEDGLPDQWIDVTGVPYGPYWLEVVVDPENHIAELNETNNTVRLLIDYQRRESLPPDPLEPSEHSLDPRDLGNGADIKFDNLSIHQPGNDDWYYWTAPNTGVRYGDRSRFCQAER